MNQLHTKTFSLFPKKEWTSRNRESLFIKYPDYEHLLVAQNLLTSQFNLTSEGGEADEDITRAISYSDVRRKCQCRGGFLDFGA